MKGASTEWKNLVARAEVIDVSKLTGDRIKFGATVTMIDEDTEEEKIYQIVGDQEADVKEGRISISSPDRARPLSARAKATQLRSTHRAARVLRNHRFEIRLIFRDFIGASSGSGS